jgi:hypothetical protein
VTVPFEEELLGTCVSMQITECFRWHIEGEILQRNLKPVVADRYYFEKAKEILAKRKINYKKKTKKMNDKTKEKLKELIDLEEESESENEVLSESDDTQISEEKEVEVPQKVEQVVVSKNENPLKGTQFEEQLNIYMEASKTVKKMSLLELVAIILFIAGVFMHIFGL